MSSTGESCLKLSEIGFSLIRFEIKYSQRDSEYSETTLSWKCEINGFSSIDCINFNLK